MDYKQIIDKLVKELSFRVGIPNIHNKEHQSIMSEILSEWGEYEVKDTIFSFLNEQDKKFKNPLLNRTVKYRDKRGNDKEGIIGNLLTSPKESPGRKAAERMLPADGTPERDAINKEVGSQGGGGEKKDDTTQDKDKIDSDETKKQDGVSKTLGAKSGYGKKQSNLVKKVKDAKKAKETPKVKQPESFSSPTINRGGDSDIKNEAIKYGYREVKDKNGKTIFKPAPGNAGSLLNEVISGEVAQMLEENPNATDEEILGSLYKRFGDSELFKSTGKNGNSGSKPAGGIKKSEVPEEYKKNAGLYSKTILAIRSGRRKYDKALSSANSQGFENPKIQNYYGHSQSFDAMVNDIKDKQVIGPDGTEISQEEAEKLIRSGGRGDNPSDTATLVNDEKTNKVIMLFHSDKDSTDAIVAQSSLKAETESNEANIDDLVTSGKISNEKADKIKEAQKELVEKNEEIESELKGVTSGPAKFFLENVKIDTALESIKNDTDSRGNKDKNKTSTKLKSSIYSRGKVHPSIKSYLENEKNDSDYTEEELVTAYFKYMADENKSDEPTNDQVTLMERLNSRFGDEGAPDIFSQLEDIRNRTLKLQRDFITEQDVDTVDINGNQVGIGTYLEANTVWKQFHLESVDKNSNKGVHKYPGMFETNHGGLPVDGDTLTECMGGDVANKKDFASRFEVGPMEEQKGVSGDQKGLTTGGKRIVYAITSGGQKIPVGQKVMRTKTGKTGKLQTVYQWSDEMKDCFKSKQQ